MGLCISQSILAGGWPFLRGMCAWVTQLTRMVSSNSLQIKGTLLPIIINNYLTVHTSKQLSYPISIAFFLPIHLNTGLRLSFDSPISTSQVPHCSVYSGMCYEDLRNSLSLTPRGDQTHLQRVPMEAWAPGLQCPESNGPALLQSCA